MESEPNALEPQSGSQSPVAPPIDSNSGANGAAKFDWRNHIESLPPEAQQEFQQFVSTTNQLEKYYLETEEAKKAQQPKPVSSEPPKPKDEGALTWDKLEEMTDEDPEAIYKVTNSKSQDIFDVIFAHKGKKQAYAYLAEYSARKGEERALRRIEDAAAPSVSRRNFLAVPELEDLHEDADVVVALEDAISRGRIPKGMTVQKFIVDNLRKLKQGNGQSRSRDDELHSAKRRAGQRGFSESPDDGFVGGRLNVDKDDLNFKKDSPLSKSLDELLNA